jgi:valyl-tRNA synthetase
MCYRAVKTLLGSTNAPVLVMEELKQIVTAVRNIRAQKNIPPKEALTLNSPVQLSGLVNKLANCDISMQAADTDKGSAATFIVGTTEYSVPLDRFINVDEELKKLEADLAHQEGFLRSVMAKLGNERFMQNAKPEVVELERKKQHDAEARIATLKENIAALQSKKA